MAMPSQQPILPQEASVTYTIVEMRQSRSALWVVVIALALTIALDLFAFFLAFRSGTWQLFALGFAILGLLIVCLASFRLVRRDRPTPGIWLIFGGAAVATLFATLLVAGLGMAIGVVVGLGLLQIAVVALPEKQTSWGIIASIVVGALVPLVDLFGSAQRLAVPSEMRLYIPLVAAGWTLLFVFLFVRQFSNYSLSTKLMIAFLAVSLLPVGLLAYLNVRSTQAALTDDANQALFATASQTADRIDALLIERLDDVSTQTNIQGLVEILTMSVKDRFYSIYQMRVNTSLRRFNAKDPANILSIAVLDAEGQNVADTSVLWLGRDESSRACFRVPLQTGRAYVSPVLFLPGFKQPFLCFSSPVRDYDGNVVGVLRMYYSAAVLQQLMVENNGRAGPASFGVLFDENYLHLAHGTTPDRLFKTVAALDPSRVAELQAAQRLPDLPIGELSTNLPDFERDLAGATDQPFFTARDAPTEDRLNQVAVATLDAQPWLVAFFQPRDIVLAPAQLQIRITSLLAAAIAGVVVAAAMATSQFLSGPINRLTAVAARVRGGDLTAQASVESGDEVGLLATTFNTMTAQLNQTLAGLEQRVTDRTRDLERRSLQLRAAAEVGHAAAAIRNLSELLPHVTQLISERFGFYHAGVFLMDEAGEYAVLQAANSEGGQRMLARGHRLRVGEQGIVGYVTGSGKPRIALDVGQDAVHFENPDLPNTRSEMALPLIVGERVLGALDVQSTEAAAFSQEDVAVLQVLANQVAIAIENARLFEELQASLREINTLYQRHSRETWSQLMAGDRPTGYEYDRLRTVPVQRRFGPDVAARLQAGQVVTIDACQNESGQQHSTLIMPIMLRDQVVGAIGFEADAPDRQWSSEEIDVVATVTGQVALALENARLLEETQRRAARERMTGELTARVRASTEVDTILQTAIRELGRVLRASDGLIWLGGVDGAASPSSEIEGDGQ